MPPLREIQNSGILWGLGTDAFEVNPYRPFQTLHWAVTDITMVGGKIFYDAATEASAGTR